MSTVRQHWIAGLLGVIMLLGLAVIYNIARSIGQPFGGFYGNRNYTQNVWRLEASNPTWWPNIANGLVQADDILIALDGRRYGSDTSRIYLEAVQAGRSTVNLTIIRQGATLELFLPIQTFTPGNFLDLILSEFIQALGFWLLAVAVYRARPTAPVNRIFAIVWGLAAGVLVTGVPALFPDSREILTQTLRLVWIITASYIGLLFIHFALMFPDPIRRISLHRLNFLYLFMTGLAGLFVFSFVLRWQHQLPALADRLSAVCNQIVVGTFGLSAAIYIARLLWLVAHPARSRRIHRQAILILLGLVGALPYIFVILARSLIQQTSSSSYYWQYLDVRFLVLALPLALAYVILRYQTSQSIHPTLVWVFILASSALVASLGEWIVRLLDPPGVNALQVSPFVSLFIVAFISGLFWRRQNSLQGVFTRLFQWDQRSYAEARRFGQHLIGQNDLAQLPATIAAALVTHLQLERAAVWLWNDKENAFRLAGHSGNPKDFFEDRLSPDEPLSPRPIHLLTVTAPPPTWLAPLGASGNLEVIAPLLASGQPVGLLGLGKRWDDEIFDERDLEILDLIAQQAALFLLTARQIEQLRQVPAQISAAQERERFGIAQELHDTVQQFLGRLPFYLQVIRDSLHTDPAEAERLLQRSLSEVEMAAQTVRQIRNNLAPLQLEQTFTQPLLALVEHFRARTGLAVSLTLFPDLDVVLPTAARHALYRVIQQALDNIAEHAQAHNIGVTLSQVADRLHFTITDDGMGFTPDQRAHAEGQGSFGLQSMRARITALGGEFAIQSQPEQGTAVTGWLPCQVAD